MVNLKHLKININMVQTLGNVCIQPTSQCFKSLFVNMHSYYFN
jgi:hypothetical protein